jgi:Uncharacterized conserved protein, contains double-stranded beta-helix domain
MNLNWERIEEERMNPLVTRKVIHGAQMTVARLRLSKSAKVPEHSHVHEQLSMVESGKLLFVVAGKEFVLGPGDVMPLAPHVPHWVEALEDTVAVDVFSPAREDWIRGDDAYLRK